MSSGMRNAGGSDRPFRRAARAGLYSQPPIWRKSTVSGEQTQLGEQLPDIPDMGSPQAIETLIGARGFGRGPPPVRVTRGARSTPRGRPSAPGGLADRLH